MRHLTATTAAVATALIMSLPVLANAPPPPAEPAPSWEIEEDPVWALRYGADGDVRIACEEGAKTLRVSIVPDWERDYGKDDGSVFKGPYDKAAIQLGDKTFEGTLAAPTDDGIGTTYLLPADADTVTALMLGTNAKVTLTADGQTREGTPDASGAFDMFATTCAQINGLR